MSEHVYHTTSEDGLHRILGGGKIKALAHVARDTPYTEVRAETSYMPWAREVLPAKDAVKKMQGRKEVDKIFLTKGRWLPNYGDYVIAKKMSDRYVSKRVSFNSIPDEYTTKRALSAMSNAKVFAPKERLDELRSLYPKVTFENLENLKAPRTSLADRISAYPGKVRDFVMTKLAEENPAKKFSTLPDGTKIHKISRNAFLSGSTALGLSVDNSDVDVFVPYKREADYKKAVARLMEKYPSLKEGAFSKHKLNKTVLTGKLHPNGPEIDLVLGYGGKPLAFSEAFRKAQQSLTPEMKSKIVKRKAELKSSWFFPETRYKTYKKQVAKDLDLAQHYF